MAKPRSHSLHPLIMHPPINLSINHPSMQACMRPSTQQNQELTTLRLPGFDPFCTFSGFDPATGKIDALKFVMTCDAGQGDMITGLLVENACKSLDQVYEIKNMSAEAPFGIMELLGSGGGVGGGGATRRSPARQDTKSHGRTRHGTTGLSGTPLTQPHPTRDSGAVRDSGPRAVPGAAALCHSSCCSPSLLFAIRDSGTPAPSFPVDPSSPHSGTPALRDSGAPLTLRHSGTSALHSSTPAVRALSGTLRQPSSP